MPAHRSTFRMHVLPAVVFTAFLVTGLEAASAPYDNVGLRDCGRSYDPCLIEGLVAVADRPSPAATEQAFAAQAEPATHECHEARQARQA